MTTLCIYHSNCADGFTSAWVVRKALGADVEFHPGVYQQSPPDVTGKDVVIVDFSYSYEVLVEMSFKAKSILILDHHKTAAEALDRLPLAGRNAKHLASVWGMDHSLPNVAALFDIDRSGAGITWDFYFPDSERPALINHVEDRDLWRFNLPYTREIQANVFSYAYEFEIWDRLMATDPAELAKEGAAIDRKHFKDIHELLTVVTRQMRIGGHIVPVANLPYTLTSDAGHALASGFPFGACYWDTPEGRVFSLRSTDAGVDVSEVAKQYGGGGHRNASGFKVSFAQAAEFEVPHG